MISTRRANLCGNQLANNLAPSIIGAPTNLMRNLIALVSLQIPNYLDIGIRSLATLLFTLVTYVKVETRVINFVEIFKIKKFEIKFIILFNNQ
jgi:hypothetical protein